MLEDCEWRRFRSPLAKHRDYDKTEDIPPLSGLSTKDEDGGRRNDVGVGVKCRLSAMHRCGRSSAFSDLSLAPLHLRYLFKR